MEPLDDSTAQDVHRRRTVALHSFQDGNTEYSSAVEWLREAPAADCQLSTLYDWY